MELIEGKLKSDLKLKPVIYTIRITEEMKKRLRNISTSGLTTISPDLYDFCKILAENLPEIVTPVELLNIMEAVLNKFKPRLQKITGSFSIQYIKKKLPEIVEKFVDDESFVKLFKNFFTENKRTP